MPSGPGEAVNHSIQLIPLHGARRMTQAVQPEYVFFLATVICPRRTPDTSIAFSKMDSLFFWIMSNKVLGLSMLWFSWLHRGIQNSGTKLLEPLNCHLGHWIPLCLKIDHRVLILLNNIFPFWLSIVGIQFLTCSEHFFKVCLNLYFLMLPPLIYFARCHQQGTFSFPSMRFSYYWLVSWLTACVSMPFSSPVLENLFSKAVISSIYHQYCCN